METDHELGRELTPRQRHLALVTMAIYVALTVAWIGQPACAKAPPTVTTPQGVAAFQNLQIAKAIDTIRDIAIDANAQQPPVLSTDSTRAVVTWHRSALLTLNARQAGWVSTLTTGLDELLSHMSVSERQLLRPYVTLAQTILVEATKP